MQQIRDEVADGLAHLVTATTDSGTAIGKGSRRAEAVTRQRAIDAVQALRGRQPQRARWRWVGVGLVTGFLGGVAVAMLVRSDQRPTTATSGGPPEAGITDTVRQKGRTAAQVVKDKTAIVKDKASTARETAAAKLQDAPTDPASGHDDTLKKRPRT